MLAGNEQEQAFLTTEKIEGLIKFGRNVSLFAVGMVALCLVLSIHSCSISRQLSNIEYIRRILTPQDNPNATLGQLANIAISDFAVMFVGDLGNINKETVDSVLERSYGRMTPFQKQYFKAYMDVEIEHLKAGDMAIYTSDPEVLYVQQLSHIGSLRWQVLVRVYQRFQVGLAKPLERRVDVMVVVIEHECGAGRMCREIESFDFPRLFTKDGVVQDVLILPDDHKR